MSDTIADNLRRVAASLPPDVRLLAVSKFHPAEAVLEAYSAGQRHFGESRVQELIPKVKALPADINWHFIGHLQTNKVRQLIGLCYLIESVDSLRLLEAIDRESLRAGVVTRILMQVHVAREETKFGFTPDEILDYFSRRQFESLQATHICGLMGMASNTDDTGRITTDFRTIRSLYDKILRTCPDLRGFDTISMGMSDDREIAIREGSTQIRVGTDIFGIRDYGAG
ncbi:MAG: YggS family pyridoxal phosphate-dependent enzyme [Muribaculaceae bacterium]|nr:YggS family pyridoxal phosphate-dependent enzyme [Muribaculaceae bacterium]